VAPGGVVSGHQSVGAGADDDRVVTPLHECGSSVGWPEVIVRGAAGAARGPPGAAAPGGRHLFFAGSGTTKTTSSPARHGSSSGPWRLPPSSPRSSPALHSTPCPARTARFTSAGAAGRAGTSPAGGITGGATASPAP